MTRRLAREMGTSDLIAALASSIAQGTVQRMNRNPVIGGSRSLGSAQAADEQRRWIAEVRNELDRRIPVQP